MSTAGAGLLAALLPVMAQSAAPEMPDQLDTPPTKRSFVSPSGRYRLEIELVQRTPPWRVDARLLATDGVDVTGGRTLWQQRLPHEGGPRTALVSDRGAVVLVDDWIRVLGPRALTLLAPDGRLLAGYSADQVIERVQRSRREVADAARFGTWMSDEAALSRPLGPVILRCANRGLALDLDTGRLTPTD